MSDLLEWLADIWWTIRQWWRLAYGTADRWWWRMQRRLFGPGPQSTLTLANTADLGPGQMLVIEPDTPRQDVVRVVSVEGRTVTVEGTRRFWRRR